MKHLLPFALGFVFCIGINNTIFSQNLTSDYVVVSTADVADPSAYISALDAANWEPFRLQNQRYQLSFENGFTIELKSAVELLNAGYPLNIPTYRTENPVGYIPPTLELLSGNVIGVKIHSTPGKSH